jgi:hypothetical protein
MTSDEGHRPVDERDFAVLQEVRALWDAVDPPPEHLSDWVLFAMDPVTAETELLKAGGHRELVAARGDESTRSITFDGTRLTVVVTLTPAPDGAVRLDGWIAPPAAHAVELRAAGGVLAVRSDERGRFVFDRVGRGMVQLVIHDGDTTVTPSIVV